MLTGPGSPDSDAARRIFFNSGTARPGFEPGGLHQSIQFSVSRMHLSNFCVSLVFFCTEAVSLSQIESFLSEDDSADWVRQSGLGCSPPKVFSERGSGSQDSDL